MPLEKLTSPHSSGLSQSDNRLARELIALLDIDVDDYAPMDDPNLFLDSRERRLIALLRAVTARDEKQTKNNCS
ncbi:hypothetical protein HU230_0042395 (plasmid) [Bradyrhizobium quebecense]|uniref:Uncharacterized protein n=1 Tax=Bradyrhizobium quebecense TaxID=2748629 RepID=A0A973WVS9_9BRAD|nr:hypothetical protein [Bradyrhizobium quebecense]UGA48997.1 hypothetical protein HU230_0042395 [Bradyrhizobium quebecense]